jgi:membrane protein DedA with SNARE-associated domain
MSQGGNGIAGWITSVVDSIGAAGVGLLIALENVFPPIPSEVVLPFAGFSAARGELNVVLAWAAATAGSVLGAYVLYAIAARIGYDRLHDVAGRPWFLLFSEDDLARGERFFRDHGDKVVLLARFVPLLRSVVSVPAGFARMPLVRFTALTAIGSGIWNAVFLYAGYRLGADWARVQQWLGPVGIAIAVALALAIALLVARQLKHRT